MRTCPHCSRNTLPLLTLLRSTRRRPVRCAQCGGHAYLPFSATVPIAWALEFTVLFSAALALWFGGMALLLAPVIAVAFAWLLARGWPLRRVALARDGAPFARPSPHPTDHP